MKFFIVLSALVAVSAAKPSLLYAQLTPGAPIGLDGRVVDTPEVSFAKAEHAAAHINEKISLASEAAKSGEIYAYAAAPVAVAAAPVAVAAAPIQLAKYTAGGAPIGLDGRVLDTPEVVLAKAEHANAHIREKIEHLNEEAKAGSYVPILPAAPFALPAAPIQLTKYTAGGAPIGLDGRVVDTPEVAYAKAEHAAARINEKLEQGSQIFRNSLQAAPAIIPSYAIPAYATSYYY